MGRRWARVRATRWVLLLGRLQWLFLVLSALSALVLGMAGGAVLVGVVLAVAYAGAAAAWRALLAGFDDHRRGAWQLLVGLALVDLAVDLVRLVGGVPVLAVPGLLLDGLVLALLQHPDTREWVEPDEPAAPPRWAGRGGAGVAPARALAHDHRRRGPREAT